MNRRSFLVKAGVALLATQTSGILSSNFSSALACCSKVTLKIGYLPVTDHLLMIAAVREKFKNLVVQPVKFSSWMENAEALKAGDIDGSFLLTPKSLKYREKDVPIRAVLLGHRNGSSITVKDNGDIISIKDLKGKIIAIPSPCSTHNILLRKILAENGIDAASDLTIISLPPRAMLETLVKGRIHGFIVAEPFGIQAESEKIGKVLMLSKDIWHDHICCVLNLRENIIDKYPEVVQELVTGFTKTASFITSDPLQAAKESVSLLGHKQGIIEQVLTSPPGRVTFNNLVPEVADFYAIQKYMKTFGLPGANVDLSDYINNTFAIRAIVDLQKADV